MRTQGIICLCFFLLSITAFAQSYSFKNYTTNDGLIQTDITSITQDKKGNIWIGTNGGISIFDGKKFTNYDDHDVLQSLRINALLCDSAGVMWVATRNGLLKYIDGFEVFFKPDSNRNNVVTCLTTNSQNLLLFVCNNIIYQVKNNKVEKYHINNWIENDAMFVAFDRDDRLWIVTGGMNIYKKAFNTVTTIKTPFSAEDKKMGLGMVRVLGKEASVPYFITNFGAYSVQDDSLQYFIKDHPKYSDARIGQAMYVQEENDSTLWVGGVVGLAKLSEASVVRFTKANGFCDNSVSCIFTDKEKNVWIGCTYNGVYKLSNEALFHLRSSNEAIDLRHVSDILSLSNHATLLGTWGKGLYMLHNGDSVSRVPLPPQLRYITSMLPSGEHTYIGWFGNGLYKMNNKTFALSEVPNFAREGAIDRMFRMGGQLVIQMVDYTCYVTDLNFNIKASTLLPEDFKLTVLKDKIYQVGSDGHVDILDNNLKVVKRNIFPDVSSRITEIVCYRDNFLLATFGQGLYLYNQWGKLIKKLDKRNGLNTNIITSLLVDGSNLFIGTNLGLAKAVLPDLNSIKIFNEDEGMFNWECRPGGLRKMSNGGIVIATTNGPYIYYPAKDISSQYTVATLSIETIRYGASPAEHPFRLANTSNIQLPETIRYEDNDITIILKGVSQRNPGDITYHYQLQGYDSMWISTANPVIKFNDLDPGDYRMRAYVTTGDYTSKQVFVKFSIDKPLSGRLWFQALLVLLFSLLCWLLLTVGNRIYQKYIQAKMIGKLEADVALKQKLTTQSILFGQDAYRELNESLKSDEAQKHLEQLVPLFLKDISGRISLLWKKDQITVAELHNYFDELLADYEPGAKMYHKMSAEEITLSMPAAFHLFQTFSLYLFLGLYENRSPVFSLDTEKKSNGHLLFRFYRLNHAASSDKTCTYHFLKDAIDKQKPQGVTIDVIENLEFGNMIIAELNMNKT